MAQQFHKWKVLEMSWPDTREVAVMADRAGFEALLPVARWRGYGGPSLTTARSGPTTGPPAWRRDGLFLHVLYFHVPLTHPVAAAKQCATIDHISGGRFALNVVCGWFKNEFEMFGADWKEHDVRYEYATEWLNYVRRIWTEDGEFDFQGHGSIKIWSEPKPIHSPMPPVMNAGGSEAGQIFAATQADMNFVILKERDIEGGKSQIAHLKNMAKDAGRDVKSWIHVYVVCRDTEKEAQDYLNHYVNEKGDLEAVNNLLKFSACSRKRFQTRYSMNFASTLSPDTADIR